VGAPTSPHPPEGDTDFQRDDIRAALDAMVDSRRGDLTLSLEILRDACAADDPIDAA